MVFDGTQKPVLSPYKIVIERRTRRKGGVLTEIDNWGGRDRVKLVKEGYQSLAVIVSSQVIFLKALTGAQYLVNQCTFIAGVQAQIITISYNQTDLSSQIVNALFFAGLFADIGAATLSAASGRWYEMTMPEEADHVYDWFIASDSENSTIAEEEEEEEVVKEKRGVEFVHKMDIVEKGTPTRTRTLEGSDGEDTVAAASCAPSVGPEQCWYFKERWLCVSLKAGPYIAVLGLAFLAAGVMVWVWTHQTFIVQILCSVLCALLVILLPPFVLPHDRIRALTFVKLRRFSG